MATSLPSLDALQTLSMRSLVAYATRAAHRFLRSYSIVYEESYESVFRLAEEFVRSSSISTNTEVMRIVCLNAANVCRAELRAKEARVLGAGLILCSVAMCSYSAMSVANDLTKNLDQVSRQRAQKNAALAAKKAARAAKASHDFVGQPRTECFLNDFSRLVALFGEYQTPAIGDPFDPSDDGPLGLILPRVEQL